MTKTGWLEALAAGFTIVAGFVAVAEFLAPRCPHCKAKLVVINNNYYCNNCNLYVNSKMR